MNVVYREMDRLSDSNAEISNQFETLGYEFELLIEELVNLYLENPEIRKREKRKSKTRNS